MLPRCLQGPSSTGLVAALQRATAGGFPVALMSAGCPDKATIGPSVPSDVTCSFTNRFQLLNWLTGYSADWAEHSPTKIIP